MSIIPVDKLPILYSFRRCPYAMRARIALKTNNVTVELREITLRNKPASMLAISPKGTVPVLQLVDGKVIDESWDIMCWAFLQCDTLFSVTPEAYALLEINDGIFKEALDNYKYPPADNVHPSEYYRTQGELFLNTLNIRLTQSSYLMGSEISVIDWAILPFIRQFARVDQAWFEQTPYESLKKWLNECCESTLFESVMQKYPVWNETETGVKF